MNRETYRGKPGPVQPLVLLGVLLSLRLVFPAYATERDQPIGDPFETGDDPTHCVAGFNDYLEKYFKPPAAAADPGSTGLCSADQGGKPDDGGKVGALASKVDEVSSADVPVECIQVFADRVAKPHLCPRGSHGCISVTYGACDGPDGKLRTMRDGCTEGNCLLPQPCMSDGYHAAVRSAFLGTMDCLGIDPKEVFGLVSGESGFLANIANSAGALGAGQLEPIAIRSVDQAGWFKRYVARPECARYSDEMSASLARGKTRPFPKINPCEFQGFPQNPAHNFLYAGMIYKQLQGTARRMVGAADRALSANDRQRVVHDISLYCYNGGEGGVAASFGGYLAEHGPLTSYRDFSATFRKYLREHFGETISFYDQNPSALAYKQREIAGYAASVNGAGGYANWKTGKKCAL